MVFLSITSKETVKESTSDIDNNNVNNIKNDDQ